MAVHPSEGDKQNNNHTLMKNNTKLTNASIESAGLPKDPAQAIAEYIWNGFDAGASHIAIDYDSNELGYLHKIEIADNGEGIPHENLPLAFGNFLDSTKRHAVKRSSYTRGKKGKGRFSFSLFATHASWHTTYQHEDHAYSYKIAINRDQKEHYEVSSPMLSSRKSSGTTTLLQGVFNLQEDYLKSQEFHLFLAQEFGWFLFLNQHQGFEIRINGILLDYSSLIAEKDTISLNLNSPDVQSAAHFNVQYVRWNASIGDRYYYYFLDSNHKEVSKQLSSFNNNAIDFHHSVYIQSNFFDNAAEDLLFSADDNNLFSHKEQQLLYKRLHAELRDLLDRKQKKYVLEQAVQGKLMELEEKRLLPYYESTPQDQQRKSLLIALIKEIYTADPRAFGGMKSELTKTFLGLFDLLLQTARKQDLLPILAQSVKLSDKEYARIKELIYK